MSSDITYLLIGTTTADIVKDGRILGGTVSYAAPIVHQFGHKMGILTSAPEDALMQPLYNVSDVHRIPAAHMATFENIYSDNGRLQIIHHTAKNLTVEMLPPAWQAAPLVHLAPLADDVDYGFAKQFPAATVLLTPQGYMRRWGADGIVHFKRFLDTGVLSAIDILVLSKQDIAQDPTLENEFPKYAKHVIVTNGEAGGTYYHEGISSTYRAYPVTELDPTGAGDVFAAALLASLPLVEHNMKIAIDVASRLAAMAVTVKGTTLRVTPAEIQELIQKATHQHD